MKMFRSVVIGLGVAIASMSHICFKKFIEVIPIRNFEHLVVYCKILEKILFRCCGSALPKLNHPCRSCLVAGSEGRIKVVEFWLVGFLISRSC